MRDMMNDVIENSDQPQLRDLVWDGSWALERLHTQIPKAVKQKLLHINRVISENIEGVWIWESSAKGFGFSP